MNYKMIARLYALILSAEAVFMLPAVGVALAYRESGSVRAFLLTIAATLLVAGIFALLSSKAQKGFYAKEGFVCVSTSWVLMSLLGALPFFLSGQIPKFIDALFEIVSGFTTTGATILSDVEALDHAMLYWRSFSHWIGGMGVLVFLLAVVPLSGKNEGFTMHLLRAESPGPDVGKLRPRIRQTASILYVTYIVLTILDFLFLLPGMSPFESICTALGTAGTGGFGILNDSIASYSPYTQNVCTVFMFLFGVNFSCYYLLLLGQVRSVFKDEELKFYLATIAISIGLVTWNIRYLPGIANIWDALRHAAFQVASIISTTGFGTMDINAFPTLSKMIFLLLMIFGSCAGSTCGGIKCIRVILLFKGVKRNISKMIHPQKVQKIRVSDKIVDEQVMANTNAYLSAYVILLSLSCILLAFDRGNFGVDTIFSSVLSCFNNIGPAFNLGPGGNGSYELYSVFSKIVLIFDMLAGRLEIFPILMIFSGMGIGRKNRR